jgi:quercetin dioxygenase-like cupin family protein
MKTASLVEGLTFSGEKPDIKLLFETDNTKEIRIALAKDQVMKEHKTKYPIVVELFEGEIDFTVLGETHRLKKGAILALEGNILHELLGIENSVVRLSLSKADTIKRVYEVIRD